MNDLLGDMNDDLDCLLQDLLSLLQDDFLSVNNLLDLNQFDMSLNLLSLQDLDFLDQFNSDGWCGGSDADSGDVDQSDISSDDVDDSDNSSDNDSVDDCSQNSNVASDSVDNSLNNLDCLVSW